MLFVLSIPVISDTIRSLAAMRSLTMPDSGHSMLSPLLDPSRRALTANMVRQSFAETVLGLMPYVSDCTLGNETSTSDPGHTAPDSPADADLMSVEIDLPCRLNDSALWAIRRGLEQSVAMTALARLTAAAQHEDGTDGWLAEAFADEARDALQAVRKAIAAPPPDTLKPFVRH